MSIQYSIKSNIYRPAHPMYIHILFHLSDKDARFYRYPNPAGFNKFLKSVPSLHVQPKLRYAKIVLQNALSHTHQKSIFNTAFILMRRRMYPPIYQRNHRTGRLGFFMNMSTSAFRTVALGLVTGNSLGSGLPVFGLFAGDEDADVDAGFRAASILEAFEAALGAVSARGSGKLLSSSSNKLSTLLLRFSSLLRFCPNGLGEEARDDPGGRRRNVEAALEGLGREEEAVEGGAD